MRPPLPPTYTSELTGHNRRIGSLEKSQVAKAGQAKHRAELRIHKANSANAVYAMKVEEEQGFGYPADGFDLPGLYWSEWYSPTTPTTFTRLTIEGPGSYYQDLASPDRWRVAIEVADPSSTLVPQIKDGSMYIRDYRPGDDTGTKNVAVFDVPYPQLNNTQPIIVKLPSPILVTQHQKIRVVRWHQTYDPAVDPIVPIVGYSTRWPDGILWPSGNVWPEERTDTRTYDLYIYNTDVSWVLTGESSKPVSAEVQSIVGRIKQWQNISV